jgi:uncharacterized protein (TIGR02284 family)
MVTFAGSQSNFFEALYRVIELDFDAVKAYQAAIERLDDEDYKETLGEFMEDHQRHIDELSAYLRKEGKQPPVGADMKSILTQGKVVIAGLASDQAILRAMLSNEEDTNTAYERISSHPDKPQELNDVLNKALQDEHRHREWVKQELEQDYQATGS